MRKLNFYYDRDRDCLGTDDPVVSARRCSERLEETAAEMPKSVSTSDVRTTRSPSKTYDPDIDSYE